MKNKITRTLIANTQPNTREQIIWDTEVAGLGVRVTSKGGKSYILKARLGRGRDARVIKPTLGAVGDMTPDQARDMARTWKAEAREGIDPAQRQREEASAPTIARLCKEYMDRHGQYKRSAREDQRLITKHVLTGMAGSKRVKDVTRRDISSLHRSLAATPVQANRTLSLVSKMFSEAVSWDWIEKNPAVGVKKLHEEGRERYLNRDELKRLSDALAAYEASGDPDRGVAADALRLMVLTGARKGELLLAEWDQIDLEDGVWSKPSAHTKQKRIHRVPLSAPAVDLLQRIKERGRGQWVFPGRNGGHRRDLKSAWEEIRVMAQIQDVHMHDLRHTYASLLVTAGVSLPVIGKLLGHTQMATTQRYAHLADEPLRDATDIAGRIISGG